MADDKFLDRLSEAQKAMSSRIFDLVIGEVLKRAYAGFNEETKQAMDVIFLSDDDKKKEEFIKKNIPDFKGIFQEEVEKIEQQIKLEIEKRI